MAAVVTVDRREVLPVAIHVGHRGGGKGGSSAAGLAAIHVDHRHNVASRRASPKRSTLCAYTGGKGGSTADEPLAIHVMAAKSRRSVLSVPLAPRPTATVTRRPYSAPDVPLALRDNARFTSSTLHAGHTPSPKSAVQRPPIPPTPSTTERSQPRHTAAGKHTPSPKSAVSARPSRNAVPNGTQPAASYHRGEQERDTHPPLRAQSAPAHPATPSRTERSQPRHTAAGNKRATHTQPADPPRAGRTSPEPRSA